MKHRLPRRRRPTPTDEIVNELREIRLLFYQLVAYKKSEENRQQFFSDIASGMVPMLQKYVADVLSPKHPVMPYMPLRYSTRRIRVFSRIAREKRKAKQG